MYMYIYIYICVCISYLQTRVEQKKTMKSPPRGFQSPLGAALDAFLLRQDGLLQRWAMGCSHRLDATQNLTKIQGFSHERWGEGSCIFFLKMILRYSKTCWWFWPGVTIEILRETKYMWDAKGKQVHSSANTGAVITNNFQSRQGRRFFVEA